MKEKIFEFIAKNLKSIVPDRFFPWLVDVKSSLYSENKKIYYSQFGEDTILRKLLGGDKGFYVDVGAYHPKRFSNTYLLYKKGWRGINIDPDFYSIKLFNKYRKNDVNLELGIFAFHCIKTLYMFSHSNWNTFSKEKAEEWKKKTNVRFLGEKQLLCLPLSEVLDQHLPRDTKIDLLNVDAEGVDLEVLKSNNWTKYQPLVIVVECPDFDLANPMKSEIYAFLASKSYRLYAFIGLSLIFIRHEQ